MFVCVSGVACSWCGSIAFSFLVCDKSDDKFMKILYHLVFFFWGGDLPPTGLFYVVLTILKISH